MKQVLNNNEIYQILRNEILDFTFTPGVYISESELTKRFDISRTPIREVLKKLEYDGLVKIVPNKATQVTAIDFKSILNFMYIREKLEIGLIDDLISIISTDSKILQNTMVAQETISQLTLIVARQNKIISSDLSLFEKSKGFLELDNEFHKCIFSSLNKLDLWSYLMNLLPDYVRFRTMVTEFYTLDDLNLLLLEHKQILEYITNEDFEPLKKIYKSHITGGVNLFQKIIEEKETYFLI